MKRYIYISPATGQTIFFPAPDGQREPCPEELFEDLRENGYQLYCIDDEELVRQYVEADNHLRDLFDKLVRTMYMEKDTLSKLTGCGTNDD